MNKLTTVTAPTAEVLTLPETKNYLGQEDDSDDAYIRTLIESTRIDWERYGRQYVLATYDYKISHFAARIEIPKPPLVSITSIKYIDSASVEQTISSAVYDVVIDKDPGFLRVAYDQTWPSDLRGHPDDITIRFVAGFSDPISVPADVKVGMLKQISFEYDGLHAEIANQRSMQEWNAIQSMKMAAGMPRLW